MGKYKAALVIRGERRSCDIIGSSITVLFKDGSGGGGGVEVVPLRENCTFWTEDASRLTQSHHTCYSLSSLSYSNTAAPNCHTHQIYQEWAGALACCHHASYFCLQAYTCVYHQGCHCPPYAHCIYLLFECNSERPPLETGNQRWNQSTKFWSESLTQITPWIPITTISPWLFSYAF